MFGPDADNGPTVHAVCRDIRAASPARSGNLSSSRSTALCVSDPGIVTSLTSCPQNMVADSMIATNAVAHTASVRRAEGMEGCRLTHPRHGDHGGHPRHHWAVLG